MCKCTYTNVPNVSKKQINFGVIKKKTPLGEEQRFCISFGKNLFLSFFHMIFVTVHEFIYTTGSIYQFNLTSIERV